MMDTKILLQNSVIKLRALEPDDLDLLYLWENDTKLWRHGSSITPYSRLALRDYIAGTLEMDIYQSKQLRLMIDLIGTDVTVGTIDLYELDARNHHAGIGILIDEAHRKNKYAYMALDLMRDYAFNMLKLKQLYAYIGAENKMSVKLFEKAGYQAAGILKEWVITLEQNKYEDVHIMQLINK